jgi:hypothetical protein
MSPETRTTTMPSDNDPVFSREEAAAFLGVAPQTLAAWSVDGRGPTYSRTGPTRGRVMYRRSALVEFLNQTVVTRPERRG